MKKISNSEIETYLQCREKHRLAYLLGVRPVETGAARLFGTAIHKALELWLGGSSAEEAIRSIQLNDPYAQVRAEAMIAGYLTKWPDRPENFKAEVRFEIPMEGFVYHGIMDGVAEGEIWEHKTTSMDPTPGSPYYTTLSFNWQVSNYWLAASSLGIELRQVIYDVIGKPWQKPYEATKNIKYRKDGQPYANQRTSAESPEEYRARLCEVVTEHHYARVPIVRLGHEVEQSHDHLVQIGREICASDPDTVAPRNPSACFAYGEWCSYVNVCAGTESLDSDKFRRR